MSISPLDLRRNYCELSLAFAARVRQDETSHCWLWSGSRQRTGYGGLSHARKRLLAHRVSYELHTGPIPAGFCILHACDNPPCVNPRHLLLGTQRENVRDRDRKGRGNTLGRSTPEDRRPRGPRHGSATHPERFRRTGPLLSDEAARDIRDRYGRGGTTHAELAARYGVSLSAIGAVVRGRTWRAADSPVPPSSYVRRPPFGRAKKLTPEAVRDMRSRYGRGGITMARLGAEYGVTSAAVGQAIRGVTWRAA